jgi:hypothetical protein
MHLPPLLLILLIALTISLISVFVLRRQTTATTAGKIAAFLGLFAFPLLCVVMGFSSQMTEHFMPSLTRMISSIIDESGLRIG